MDHAFGTPLWHKASLADWPVYILWLWGHRQEGEHAAVNKSEWICLVNMFKRIESLDWIKIPTQRMNIILFLVWINFCIIIASMHDFVFRTFWVIIQNCLTFTFLHTYTSIRLARVKARSLAQSCSPTTLKGWELQGQSSLCGWHSALYDTPLPLIWAPSDILSYSSSLRQGENLFFISSQEKKW